MSNTVNRIFDTQEHVQHRHGLIQSNVEPRLIFLDKAVSRSDEFDSVEIPPAHSIESPQPFPNVDEEKLALLAAQFVSSYHEQTDELARTDKTISRIDLRIDMLTPKYDSDVARNPIEQRLEVFKDSNTLETILTVVKVMELEKQHQMLFIECFEKEMRRVDLEAMEERNRQDVLDCSETLKELENADKITEPSNLMFYLCEFTFILALGASAFNTYWGESNLLSIFIIISTTMLLFRSLVDRLKSFNKSLFNIKFCLESLQPLLTKGEFSVKDQKAFKYLEEGVLKIVNRSKKFSFHSTTHISVFFLIILIAGYKLLFMFTAQKLLLILDFELIVFSLILTAFVSLASDSSENFSIFLVNYRKAISSHPSSLFKGTVQ